MSRKKRDRFDGYSPKKQDAIDPWVEHFDGYKNELTGIGDFLRDKTKGGISTPLEYVVSFLTWQDCAARWRGSDLGGRIVETIPDEMSREGWEISVQPDTDNDEAEKTDAFGDQPPMLPPEPKPPGEIDIDDTGQQAVEDLEGKLEALGANEAFKKALEYERAYGGGAILIGADDGMIDLKQPMNEDNIEDVRHLTVFQGGWDGEIIAVQYYTDVTEPKFGQPEIYAIRNVTAPAGIFGQPRQTPPLVYVHESRLLAFPGVGPSRYDRYQNRGWGDSIFVRIDEVLSQYGQTWGGIAILMTEFSQGILAIENLAQAMGSNNKAATNTLTKRAVALNLGRSLSRILLIDSKEKFSRDTVSLSGLAEMLQQFALRLAAAADMPVSLLMGQAPAGLNATGDSDIRFFYDRVASRQRSRLLPHLKRLVRLILKSKQGPTKGAEPSKWDVRFRSLYQMSETEKATLRKTVADADNIYITQGVVTPEEVAASRFGSSQWSMETTIDFEGRKEMAAQAEKDKAERAKQMVEAAKKQAAPDPGMAPSAADKPGEDKPPAPSNGHTVKVEISPGK